MLGRWRPPTGPRSVRRSVENRFFDVLACEFRVDHTNGGKMRRIACVWVKGNG
jgi:hypothetical protein